MVRSKYLASLMLSLGIVTSSVVWMPVPDASAADPNTFNRLMKPPSQRNPEPKLDGIHDPESVGTQGLQTPREAFTPLPKGQSGNYVDWVKAFDEKKIQPRFDRNDPKAKPVIMDLTIVREVKGSMPDVIFPHKQHTEWLDCSNCHPAPFVPQKGANQMSMASIMLGESCGVCHGKVAFPVADCRRCHTEAKKGQATKTSASAPAPKSAAKPKPAAPADKKK